MAYLDRAPCAGPRSVVPYALRFPAQPGDRPDPTVNPSPTLHDLEPDPIHDVGEVPAAQPMRRWPYLLVIGLVLAFDIGLHLALLPVLSTPRLLSFGAVAEALIAVLLSTILVLVQSRELPARIHGFLTIGLGLWLVSATADVMDEIVRQPLWVSAFVEDVPRIAGMGLASIGLLALIGHSGTMVRELRMLSLREALTGLGNRRRFKQVVAQRQPLGYALLLMDLDHFKAVNDRFGHAVGDEVLSRVADVLRDLAPSGSESFRLGGEEFAVVSEPMSDDELEALARRLCRSVAALRPREDLSVTMSVGAGRSRPEEPPLELMQRVDRALYRAKAEGRNRVALASA